MERTFVMVKPDGVQRGLLGRVISVIEGKGYKLVAAKMLKVSDETAGRHYAEHEGKPFFSGLIRHITSGPVMATVWEGPDAVRGIRNLIGATNPLEAVPGSLRGDYAVEIGHNVVHGSDSTETARREISLYFKPEELVEFNRDVDKWIW